MPLAKLTVLPTYSAAERLYPAHLSCNGIQRLARYFDRVNGRLALEHRVRALIGRRYIGRNPYSSDLIRRPRCGAVMFTASAARLSRRVRSRSWPIART